VSSGNTTIGRRYRVVTEPVTTCPSRRETPEAVTNPTMKTSASVMRSAISGRALLSAT
jgi:hypothetical protein